MVCVDSDLLIDVLRNHLPTQHLLETLENRAMILYTTSITSFEVLRGVSLHAPPEKYTRALEFLSRFTVLDFDFAASKKAAEISRLLASQGAIIDVGDIMIAAICISRDESLLTRNAKHFSKIPELRLEPFA